MWNYNTPEQKPVSPPSDPDTRPTQIQAAAQPSPKLCSSQHLCENLHSMTASPASASWTSYLITTHNSPKGLTILLSPDTKLNWP